MSTFFIAMTVSIIVPVFNQQHLLFRTLDSIPIREDIETIVVDDASTDSTWEKLVEYVKVHPNRNIKIYRNETNRGVGYTRNVAIDHASNDYIYGIDSDDYLYTDKFVQAMKQLDGTDLIYVGGDMGGRHILWINEWNKHFWGSFSLKFARREFIGKTRCPYIRFGEDKEFNEELLSKPHTEKYTGLCVYYYDHPRKGSLCWVENYGEDAGS